MYEAQTGFNITRVRISVVRNLGYAKQINITQIGGKLFEPCHSGLCPAPFALTLSRKSTGQRPSYRYLTAMFRRQIPDLALDQGNGRRGKSPSSTRRSLRLSGFHQPRGFVLVHNKTISDFRPSFRLGRRWRGLNPRQKGPFRIQDGFASHFGEGIKLPSNRRKIKLQSS
ncbi:hypothetical protein PoB_003369400 [Plakobranchus ocellatus]|uniref:Ribosomal protein S11 n=1 Tax=Plakobranchus ocellatus TaxID=259542 RepID=A0AAV4AHN0_9GAST|nr:hypothetical protein PoB_003369400 [Plakobranchus ocellatus]